MKKYSDMSSRSIIFIKLLNIIIILFAIFTYIGWITGFDELASIKGKYIPMARDTAMFFLLLSGISFLLLYESSKKYNKLFQTIVLLIGLYGLLKFAEYFINIDLTFEDLWLPASEGTDLYPVKRMSPYTGFLYILSGVAIFLPIQTKNEKLMHDISSSLGIVVFILSFVAVTGYIFDSPLLYGSGVIPIALNTAIAFMLLGLSIIMVSYKSYVYLYITTNEIFKTLLLTFIPLITVLIFVVAILSKMVFENTDLNAGLLTSLISLISLLLFINIIWPISRRIANKINNVNADLLKSQKIVKLGTWRLDLKTNKVTWSEELYKMYGFDPKKPVPPYTEHMKLFTKKSWEILSQALALTSTEGIPYELELEMVVDGNKRGWMWVKGEAEYDRHGEIKSLTGAALNITEKKENELNLEYAANNDYLTGLNNRKYFEEHLVKMDVENNYPITIVMADINGLKLVNDAFGHDSGDQLLISAANIMKENSKDNYLVARIGGDEFVIVMPRTTEKETEVYIDTISKEINKVHVKSIKLSISYGYKCKKSSSQDIREVYKSAEDLMYRQKLIEIPSMRSGAIETILKTLYEKDKNSELHSRTVSQISEKLARAYGLNSQDVAEVKTAGLLHDIGKIIIPLEIITKDGKLTFKEYEIIKTHSEIGFRILNSTQDMRSISDIVLNHHEREDGKGYPRGIKGSDIPIKSKIIAIADAFDAMTSKRTYRKVISREDALQEIMNMAGTQFDLKIAKVFQDNFQEIIA